jgi:myo-inositol 2-dehydrogenase/D-chiro-inositol 1-dehydrogenase
VPDYFTSEFMIRDSVVHEVDVARFLLDEEITSVQVLRGVATSAAPQGTSDPMVVVFETASGRLVTDEIYVRSGIAYEVRTEVVGERGSAMIGLDTNLVRTTTDGRRGGVITPGFVERFGQAYDTELQRWVAAARQGTIDGPGVWDGYAAVAVCEAGVQALRTGEKVPVVLQPRPGSTEGAPGGSGGSDGSAGSASHPDRDAGILAPDLIGDEDGARPAPPAATPGHRSEPEPGITAPDLIGDRP